MTHRKLARLHAYNGWNLLFLVLSGVILFVPQLRGALAPVRTPLKYLHIGSGILSLGLLALYLPLAREHWGRMRQRVGQKANVVLLTGLLLGWGLTGVLLWFNRYMPAGVAESALVWHDLLTWFAVPWAAAHAVTRYFRLRVLPVVAPVQEDRRVLLAGVLSAAGFLLWGRLGRGLGVPGLEGASEAGDRTPNRLEPLPEGAAFNPVPVSDPPQGGGGKGRFRMYSVVAPLPTFDARTWQFTVQGLVDRPLTLSWEAFQALNRTVQVSNFHCVTGWSVYSVTWEGVRLSHLLDLAGVKPGARYVKFYSGDGAYTDALPLEVARAEDVMLPYIMDGRPLPTPLGGPVRLIVPQMYAYKSVKWVQAIELLDRNHEGYWEVRGYPNDAWVRKEG
ncbi:MAG TPA: molybdopterin-dependent oxidoreductase [Symbiobacteriaceae bacterium]|nr:molybdopterin-dependent oxidoreductase [Symbiobacteriaceae bacterium]